MNVNYPMNSNQPPTACGAQVSRPNHMDARADPSPISMNSVPYTRHPRESGNPDHSMSSGMP